MTYYNVIISVERKKDVTLLKALNLDILTVSDCLSEGRMQFPGILTEDEIKEVQSRGFQLEVVGSLTETARERLREVLGINPLANAKKPEDLEAAFARPTTAAERSADTSVQGYMNTELIESATALLATVYPSWVKLIKLPNKTIEGRTSNAIRIRAGSKEKRHGILFIAGLHAREWGGPDICVNFAHNLLNAYFKLGQPFTLGNKTYTYEQVKAIMENLDIFIFPDVNPDGRAYSQTFDPATRPDNEGAWWRKNRRRDPKNPNLVKFGVDLNRNFNFLWGENIHNSSCFGDGEYKGSKWESEPETRNVVYLFNAYKNIRYLVDIHSFGNLILYPWGNDDNQNTDLNMHWRQPPRALPAAKYRGWSNDWKPYIHSKADPCDEGTEMKCELGADQLCFDAYKEFISTLDENTVKIWGRRMGDAIQDVAGNFYCVEQDTQLYPTAGTVTNYAFARNSLNRIYSYTIEFGPAKDMFVINEWPDHVIPPFERMRYVVEDVNAAMTEFCWSVLSDLYVRDNKDDKGDVPSKGPFWNSPDIWVRNNEDDGEEHQKPIRGQNNYVYVRVNNRGLAEARHVKVRVYIARAAMGFAYPRDFVPKNPQGGGSIDPKKKGTYLIGESEIDLIQPENKEPKVAHVKWTAGLIPPPKWHGCLLVEVAPNDGPSAVNAGINGNNNLAQKNVAVVDAKPGATVSLTFDVMNEPEVAEVTEPVVAAQTSAALSAKSKPKEQTAGSIVVKRVKGPSKLGLFLDIKDQAMMKSLKSAQRSSKARVAKSGKKRAAGSEKKAPVKSLASISGFDFTKQKEKSLLSLSGSRRGSVSLPKRQEKKPKKEMSLKVVVPKDAKAGERYELHIEQQSGRKRAIGGVILEVNIV